MIEMSGLIVVLNERNDAVGRGISHLQRGSENPAVFGTGTFQAVTKARVGVQYKIAVALLHDWFSAEKTQEGHGNSSKSSPRPAGMEHWRIRCRAARQEW